MKVTHPTERASLALVHLLAQLLERIESSPAPVGAEQYRSVVRRLGDELAGAGSAEGLSAVLDANPAAAQLYENLNYQHAGLCRSPLEPSLDAEMQARKLIERARQTR
ncbi:MAG: hypothetical protein ABIR94_05645 [Rubrivivax sp.]